MAGIVSVKKSGDCVTVFTAIKGFEAAFQVAKVALQLSPGGLVVTKYCNEWSLKEGGRKVGWMFEFEVL